MPMEEKKLRKEPWSFLVNTADKATRKERRRTLFLLGGGALALGAVFGFLLGYGYIQKIKDGPDPACFVEKGLSEVQLKLAAPSVAEFQNIESASMPQSTEIATIPASKAELAAPPVVESQNLESTSTPQSTETADIPAQQAELTAQTDTEPQNVEPASTPQTSEYTNAPAPEPSNPEHTKVRKAKHKSAYKRRYVHRKTTYVTYFPERRNYHYGFPAVGN
jgi:hypothetical protein